MFYHVQLKFLPGLYFDIQIIPAPGQEQDQHHLECIIMIFKKLFLCAPLGKMLSNSKWMLSEAIFLGGDREKISEKNVK